MAMKSIPPSPGLRGVPVVGAAGQISRDWQKWFGLLSGNLALLSAASQLFIQPEAPSLPVGQTYWWVQTGLGDDGSEFTIWFEDGQQ